MNIQEYDQKGGRNSHRVFQIWSQIKSVDNDALPQINDLSDLDGVVFTEFTTSEAKLGLSLDFLIRMR